MRSSRIQKFKIKSRPLQIIVKMALICYLAIFSASYLTSNTAAYFNGEKQVSNMTITAGTWEIEEEDIKNSEEDSEIDEALDESTLAFITDENQDIEICEPATIKMKIKNDGKGDMQEESTYEVYHTENGNPKNEGEKLELAEGDGIIEVLASGETTELTYEASKPGVFIFVAYQQDDYLGDNEIWSEEINIICESVQVPDDKEDEKVPDTEEIVEDEEVQEEPDEAVEAVDEPNQDNTESKEITEPKKEAVEDQPTNIEEEDQQIKKDEKDTTNMGDGEED